MNTNSKLLIAIIALAALIAGAAAVAVYDQSDGDDEKCNYTVKNSFSSGFTVYMTVDSDTPTDQDQIGYNASKTFSMTKNQNHTIRTYFKDGDNFVLLDTRGITMSEDITNATLLKISFTKANVFTPEVLDNFTFKYSEMSSTYTINNPQFKGFSSKDTFTSGTFTDVAKDIQCKLAFYNDTYTAEMDPIGTYDTYVKNAMQGGPYTFAGTLTLTVYPGQDRVIKTFTGSDLYVGIKLSHFRDFSLVEPKSTKVNNDGTTEYTFRLGTGQKYYMGCGDNVNDHLSFGGIITFSATESKNPEVVDLTQEGYMVSEGKTGWDIITVDNITQLGQYSDAYANLNIDNSMYLKAGDTKRIEVIRTWQAMEGVTQNEFVEPYYVFTVLKCSSDDPSSVLTITNEKGQASVEGKGNGWAIVAVTYKAMNFRTLNYNSTIKDQTFYPAILPENTYIFAVCVNNSGVIPGFDLGLKINEGLNTTSSKLAGDMVDSDIDTYYYWDDDGYSFTYKPASDMFKVEIWNPVFDADHTKITGFAAGDVTKSQDGTYSFTLTEGRNVLQVTKTDGGETIYKVLNARHVSITVTNETSEERDQANQVIPGDVLKLEIKHLYPLHKLAGVYNPQSDGIVFTDHTSNTYSVNAQKQYNLLCETLTIEITVPMTEKSTYDLSAYLRNNGYGDRVGGHHLIDPNIGKPPNFSALMVFGYIGTVETMSFKVGSYYTVTYDTGISIDGLLQSPTVAAGTSYSFGDLSTAGYDLMVLEMNCSSKNPPEVSHFYKDGNPTTDIGLNTQDIEIGGKIVKQGKGVVIHKDQLTADSVYTFNASYNCGMMGAQYFSGTIKAESGTYTEEQYTADSSATVLGYPEAAAESAAAQGKTFKEWVVKGTQQIYSPGDTIQLTGDMELTAVYNESKYTVTFVAEGGHATIDKVSVADIPAGTQMSASGNVITIATATPTTVTATPEQGYTGAWNLPAPIMIFSDMTVTYTAEKDTVTVTFTINKGTISPDSITVQTGTVATIAGNTATFGYGPDAQTVTADAPANHEFRWSIPSGTQITADTKVTVDVYIKVDLRADTGGSISPSATASAHDGEIAVFSDNTVKIGNGIYRADSIDYNQYAFDHWEIDGQTVTGAYTMTQNFAAVAKFVAIEVVQPTQEGDTAVVDFSDVEEGKTGVYEAPADASGKLKITTKTAEFHLDDQSALAGKAVTASCSTIPNPSETRGVAYELQFLSNGTSVNAKMTITVPFSGDGTPYVYWFTSSGQMVPMNIVSHGDGKVTFETDHNSTYIVSNEGHSGNPGAQIFAIIAIVLGLVVVAVQAAGMKVKTKKN